MVKYLKDNLGLVLVRVLAAIPVVVWIFMAPISSRFLSSSGTFRSLGQVTGLLGMALLSLNFVLAARFRFLDKMFLGLNRVYVRHHTMGAIAFCLLLFHPVFLTIQYLLISLRSAFDFVFSIQDLPTDFGKLALLLLMALLFITFYLDFKYQNWKNTHKYLGVVLFLGGLHMLLIGSDVSNNIFLKIYMLALASLGAFSYLYRTVLGVYKKSEFRYRLEKVTKVNESVSELKFSPLSEKIRFFPGQFVFIRFEEGGSSESHPFSITSHPDGNDISLGIKSLGDYTSKIHMLKPAAVCRIEGPFGAFSYLKARSKRQIWIAGGIGITPFLSMARHLDHSGNAKDHDIELYYSVKNMGEAAFAGELSDISKRNNGLKFHEHFSEKDGYITADKILKESGDISGADIFLCGPPAFMQGLREQFVKSGFDNDRIHSEEFSL